MISYKVTWQETRELSAEVIADSEPEAIIAVKCNPATVIKMGVSTLVEGSTRVEKLAEGEGKAPAYTPAKVFHLLSDKEKKSLTRIVKSLTKCFETMNNSDAVDVLCVQDWVKGQLARAIPALEKLLK